MTHLKQELIEKREALRKSLADELSQLSELREPTSGDIVDWALDSLNGELSSQMAQTESRKLARIEQALARMQLGGYGMCEGCEQAIPAARLEALPDSTLCVACQREEEGAGSSGRHAIGFATLRGDAAAAEVESEAC